MSRWEIEIGFGSNIENFHLQKVETKEGETVVVIYFDDVSSKSLCPVVKAYRTHSVAKQKPAPVIIYDYYDSCK